VIALAVVMHMAGVGLRLSLIAAIATMTLAMVVALIRMRRKGGAHNDTPARRT